MHTARGGSIGLFAVAMSNDSVERKTRIRRSKEDRKALAESFIKKYQKLNSGIFPSLRLTHKEVGGSFYTVREIVREIIQENRVLGPVEFTTEKQKSVDISTHFSIGSVTVDPQINFPISSDETYFEHDHQLGRAVEVALNSHGEVAEPEDKKKDGGKIFHGKQPGENNIRNDKVTNLQDNETLEAENYVEERETITVGAERSVDEIEAIPFEAEKVAEEVEALTSKVEKDVEEMEAFSETPYFVPNQDYVKTGEERLFIDSNGHFSRSEHQDFENVQIINLLKVADKNKKHDFTPNESKSSDDFKGSFSNVTNITSVLVETFPLRPMTESSQCLEEDKSSKNVQISGMDLKPDFVDAKTEPSYGNTAVEALKDSTSKKYVMNDSHDCQDLVASTGSEPLEKVHAVNEITPANAPNATPIATNITSSIEDSIPQKFSKESNPTLDRINLESWASKKSMEPETNPIVAFFKAFVASFLKFWSE